MIIDLKNREILKRQATEVKKINPADKSNPEIPRAPSSEHKGNKMQWLLCFIIILMMLGMSFAVVPMWDSAWQFPKSMIMIVGTTLLLILSSILWIFGFIGHKVSINALDIGVSILGFGIGVLSLLNPNEIAFWGSTARLFDAGLFFITLTVLYIIIKLYIEPQYILRLLWVYALAIVGGTLISVISIYIPSLQESIPFLSELTPTFSVLTDSPQELAILHLIATHILFMGMYRKIAKDKQNPLLLSVLYGLSLLIQGLLIIRLSLLPLQVLTIITFIVQLSILIGKAYTNIVAIRISFVYTLLILGIIFCMIIRPFENNTQFPEYSLLAYPSTSLSIDIVRDSIQSGALFGSGSVLYVWNRFSPESINDTDLWDFSFETLSSEVFNIMARYGLLITILLGLIGLWLIVSLLRALIIRKHLLNEQYLICLVLLSVLIFPLGVVGKVLLILILPLWSYTISQYFHPLFSFSLNLRTIPSHIASVSTFFLLALMGGGVFVSAQTMNMFRSQSYVVEAQSQEDEIKKAELLSQAQQKSPFSIDYTQLNILQNISLINESALALSVKQSQEESISDEERENLTQKIDETQKLIDEYKKLFPDDVRLVQWQLDIYSITHRYDVVEESIYRDTIKRGIDLRPNYLYWDLYKAQYYIRQSQKGEELDQNQLNQAKELLDGLIARKPDFVEAYQTYYDLYGLEENYRDQIRILDMYVAFVSKNQIIADTNLVYSLGLAYQNNQQYREALLVYNTLIESLPNYVDVYFRMGEVYEVQNLISEAIAQYKKVIELDPNAQAAQEKLDNLE